MILGAIFLPIIIWLLCGMIWILFKEDDTDIKITMIPPVLFMTIVLTILLIFVIYTLLGYK